MAINPVEIIIRAKDEASSIFSSMGSKVAAVGASIAAYFGISAFVGAVKGAADLEAKLSEVQAVSGATTAEMVLLRKAAEDAGTTTKYTATEAADALGNLARAGLSAKDTIAALPAVLQLAQAGGVDLGQASEYITKAVMGMGLAFTDAGRVADVLAQGANASNTSVDGLAQALSYSAPLANTLGLSLETTVAIIGKFADAGIDASRAGTALNAIMAQFADPASKFREELAGAGITTTNFEQALRQLAAAGPAGSKAINAVGTEAGPALRALLNQGIGALDDLKAKLDNSSGSAAELARIMNDNLNGATAGLGSAWESVKNALATPVLPVLKDGVQQLSAAFTEAVSNGTIAKFGATIATAFEGGIKWVKAFAAEVDFTALYARMQTFAASAQETFTKIGEYASNAGNIVKTAYGVMSAGVNAVLVAVYGLGEAFSSIASNIQSGLSLLLQGLAKITFGGISASFKAAADEVKLSADVTWAAAEKFAQKGQQAFIDMSNGAELARDGWGNLTTSTQTAATQADAAGDAFLYTGDSIKAIGTAATDTGVKVKDSADKQQAAAAASKEKVAALRAEYEAAVATDNWQLAVEKMQALRDAAKDAQGGTADLKKKAEEDAAAIAASFERMGIKTKDQLTTFAATAKQDFERIKTSGQATAEGLELAFKKYAEAAIAANGGVASESLKVEAAMRGLQITTDSTGKAIVQNMTEGAKAVDGVGESTKQATEYMDVFARSAAEATAELVKQQEAEEAALSVREKALDLKKREKAVSDAERGVDAEGYVIDPNTGKRIESSAVSYSKRAVYDKAIEGGADEKTALNLSDKYGTDQSDPGASAWYGIPGAMGNWDPDGFQRELDAALMTAVRKSLNTSTTNTQTTSTQTAPAAQTYTVNLNINGSNTPVNVASEADATALIDALRRAQLTAG